MSDFEFLGLIAGLLLMANGFLSFAFEITNLSPIMAILNVYIFLFGAVLVILEYKDQTYTKFLLDYVKKDAYFLYRPYGRGAFYTFLGTLLVCKGGLISPITGLFVW